MGGARVRRPEAGGRGPRGQGDGSQTMSHCGSRTSFPAQGGPTSIHKSRCVENSLNKSSLLNELLDIPLRLGLAEFSVAIPSPKGCVVEGVGQALSKQCLAQLVRLYEQWQKQGEDRSGGTETPRAPLCCYVGWPLGKLVFHNLVSADLPSAPGGSGLH